MQRAPHSRVVAQGANGRQVCLGWPIGTPEPYLHETVSWAIISSKPAGHVNAEESSIVKSFQKGDAIFRCSLRKYIWGGLGFDESRTVSSQSTAQLF